MQYPWAKLSALASKKASIPLEDSPRDLVPPFGEPVRAQLREARNYSLREGKEARRQALQCLERACRLAKEAGEETRQRESFQRLSSIVRLAEGGAGAALEVYPAVPPTGLTPLRWAVVRALLILNAKRKDDGLLEQVQEELLEGVEQATESEPEVDRLACEALATLHWRKRMWNEVTLWLAAASPRIPSADVTRRASGPESSLPLLAYLLIATQVRNGEYLRALGLVQRVLDIDPGNLVAQLYLGLLLLWLGNAKSAYQFLLSLAHDTNHPLALHGLMLAARDLSYKEKRVFKDFGATFAHSVGTRESIDDQISEALRSIPLPSQPTGVRDLRRWESLLKAVEFKGPELPSLAWWIGSGDVDG